MEVVDDAIQSLRAQIRNTEDQLKQLKRQLEEAEQRKEEGNAKDEEQQFPAIPLSNNPSQANGHWPWPLQPDEYKRYGRQMILPEIGLQGQLRLKQSSVLIVGAGGLGCPAAAYIAGAGIGTLGLADGDVVEISNLHRQILHSSSAVGKHKVHSAIEYLRQLNPYPKYNAHTSHLAPTSALDLFEQYDVILDCTDHPTSRYLISDAAVLTSKPLVSASALRTEGQLLVFNVFEAEGKYERDMCYRCVFPKPPPAHTIQDCADGGILGPVVGVMGTLMALEAIKIASGFHHYREVQPEGIQHHPSASMLLYTAYNAPSFRTVRLKGKRKTCISCSQEATITRESLTSGSLDYATFCGLNFPEQTLTDHERISPAYYNEAVLSKDHLLIDVRPPTEFEICHIPGSLNVPLHRFERFPQNEVDPFRNLTDFADSKEAFIVCKRGNDSQKAVRLIKDARYSNHERNVKDIKGGLMAWIREVDRCFPEY
ncbi:MAG: hypothetical protein LQ351_007525 [Letrouitia transgressa]|nr:MAG: hypothetical protein LQ351_007525 [Letrouitia transgressa]